MVTSSDVIMMSLSLFLQSLGMCSGCGQFYNRYTPVATTSTSRRHTPRMRMGYPDGVDWCGVSAGTVGDE